MPENTAAKPVGPGLIIRVAGRSFVGVADAKFVSCVEIVIDFCVDLFSAQSGQRRDSGRIGSEYRLGTAVFIAGPPIAGCIQAVAVDGRQCW